MKHFGLMMFRGDLDILDEVMKCNHSYFDEIYVLDGTDQADVSSAIIRKYKNVVFYTKDQDLPPEYARPPRDGARQILLNEIKARHGSDGWITLLHGDEMFLDWNPCEISERADREGYDAVFWLNVPFFLHTSQAATYHYDPQRSVVEQVVWAALPGWPEIRQFKNKEGIAFSINEHGCTVPAGIVNGVPTRFPIRHYLYRDPEQMMQNFKDRSSRAWQTYGEWMGRYGCFVDILPHFEHALEIAPRRRLVNGATGELE